MKKKIAMLLTLSLLVSLVSTSAVFAEEYEDYGYDAAYEDVYNGEYEYDEYYYEVDEEAYENGYEVADEEDYEDAYDVYYDVEAYEYDVEDYAYDVEDYAYDVEDYAYDVEDYAYDVEDYAYDVEDDDVEAVPVPIVPIAAEATTIRFVIDETAFTINGVPHNLDVAPFIADGRTMVPLAAVGQGLDAVVGWDGETRNVSIVRGDIDLTINADVALPGDMGAPILRDGRTFVPIAFVANELGATTAWDGEARAVYVID